MEFVRDERLPLLLSMSNVSTAPLNGVSPDQSTPAHHLENIRQLHGDTGTEGVWVTNHRSQIERPTHFQDIKYLAYTYAIGELDTYVKFIDELPNSSLIAGQILRRGHSLSIPTNRRPTDKVV